MNTADFDYPLDPACIAQTPADRREHSRLLLYERTNRTISYHRFTDLPDLLKKRYTLIRNNAAVFPARLRGRRMGGGAVECLLLHPAGSPERWACLLRPGKRLPPGSTFLLPDGGQARVESAAPEGTYIATFTPAQEGQSILDVARAYGEIPLPPYIERRPDDPRTALDRERYQTVYADPNRPVAAAAPTAGLHFTPEILATLAERGHGCADITLHVGLGTFKPIAAEQLETHVMHKEFYEIPATTCAQIQPGAERPLLAVGTTALRAIEDYSRKAPHRAGDYSAEASLFIYPPARFRADALLTNFHLPRSTLLCLVSAFLAPDSTEGIAELKRCYACAQADGFRFYSYGDAMLIL